MTDIYASTDARLIELIGEKVKNMRLNKNQSQASLAADSGVAVTVVHRLENGAGCTLLNLIKILRGINGLEMLGDFFGPELESPRMLALRAKAMKRRRRASKKIKETPETTASW